MMLLLLQASASDEELFRLMEEVHLGDLLRRVGGLDAELDWAGTLSQGKQQQTAS